MNFTDFQLFSFFKCGKYVYIVAKVSGKVLDVNSGEKANDTNIQQYEYSGTFARQQLIIKEGKLRKFISRVNSLYLGLNEINAPNVKEKNDIKTQKFIIIPMSVLLPSKK